jgi:hypothetical protein
MHDMSRSATADIVPVVQIPEWVTDRDGLIGFVTIGYERGDYFRPVPQRRCKKRSHGENSILSAIKPITTITTITPIT